MPEATQSRFRSIDALLAIVLFVALAGVLLPALMVARADSREHTCLDNLRQLGVALRAYESQFGALPPVATGHDDADTNDLPGGNHPEVANFTTVNWVYLLLPYAGQADLAMAFNRSVPMYDPLNEKIRTTELSVMKCPDDANNGPSNPYIRVMGEGKDLKEVRYARGNYGINCGTDTGCIYPGTLNTPCFDGIFLRYADSWTFEWLGNGVAGYNKPLKLKAFMNGTSRMVALDELRAGLRSVDARGVWSLVQWGADETFGHGLHEDNGRPNSITGRSDRVKGCEQLVKLVGQEKLVQERMTCWPKDNLPQRATARSMHPGGVNVLILDGSAHFISDAVDPVAWHVMHSRNNPEKVRLPFETDSPDVTPISVVAEVRREPLKADRTVSSAKTIKNSIGMEFALIPAGEFTMGLPDRGHEGFPDLPAHQVRITTPFHLGKYEVTQGQYSKVMGSNPSWYQITGGGQHEIESLDTTSFPVEMVSWEKAVEFCRRLSETAAEKKEGRRYRLPTEAEWEYGCRAGRREPFEPEVPPAAGIKPIVVTDVGLQSPNAFGLYDMTGNVWEWCADWHAPDYYKQSPKEDPQGPKSGLLRVVRGRAWAYAGNPFGYARDPTPATRRAPILGFRVVCER